MMKKLGMIAFIMALVVAFALPAFAYTVEGAKGERFTMGGTLAYDIGYINLDKNRSGIGTDVTKLFTGVDYWSNIMGTYTVGPASFTWVLYANSDVLSYNKINNDSTTYGATQYQNLRDYIAMDVWYGSYTFGNCVLSAGKQSGSTVSFGMSQQLGYTPSGNGHVAGIAYGFVYDQKYPQLRFRQAVSKMFTYQISLVSTGTYAETVGTATRQSYATFPMIAAKGIFNFGAVSLYPAVAYQQVQWDGLASGYDSSMTAWLLRLPIMVVSGPFVGKFELTYGQNLGGGSQMANMCSGESSWGGYFRNSSGKILNANTFAGFFDLAFTFGKATPHVYAGFTQSINKDRFTVGDNSNTRTIMGANLWYTVTPNFKIIPEIYTSDLGKYPGTTSTIKLGADVVAGVQFNFGF
ncbi:MAG: hypothetical protein A2Y79_13245 [Deltaproteobacteria bacterium RBG_13_43_22]|nr:MAG: hypothetical protein A2Y79_13245 [Deltaproteobacteria bacterium RBG_13_43_22]